LGLAALFLAGSAVAQTDPAIYPKSLSRADVVGWLDRQTDVGAAQVVDVSASAVTAIVSAQPTGPRRGFKTVIRAQTLDPDFVAKQGVLAWTMPVDLDCATRRVRLGEMTGYPARSGREAPKALRPAQDTWLSPSPGAPLDHVWMALCDRQFQRPLTGVRKTAARDPTPVPPTSPEPSPPTSKPAPAAKPAPRAPAKTVTQAAASQPPHGGSVSLQVGTAGSEADARALLARLGRKFANEMGGLTPDVAKASVNGKTVYRALLGGFRSPQAATRLCEAFKAGGQACFARRSAAAS
jgi:hypothetical protein